jgi:hypothetical protein
MSALHDYDRFATADPSPTEEPSAAADSTSTLTQRLDAKLAELTGKGLVVQWLEIAEPQLVTLFEEGGDDAIRLDPDPAVDMAWYGDLEVRPTQRAYIWIFLTGEVEGEVSAHVIS